MSKFSVGEVCWAWYCLPNQKALGCSEWVEVTLFEYIPEQEAWRHDGPCKSGYRCTVTGEFHLRKKHPPQQDDKAADSEFIDDFRRMLKPTEKEYEI